MHPDPGWRLFQRILHAMPPSAHLPAAPGREAYYSVMLLMLHFASVSYSASAISLTSAVSSSALLNCVS